MHNVSRMAARIVRASELEGFAIRFRDALARAETEAELYTEAVRGDRSWTLSVSVRNVIFAGSRFFYSLLETRVLPKSKAKRLQLIAGMVFKAKRAPNKPWTWLQKYGDAFWEILNEWHTWADKTQSSEESSDKFRVGPFTVHNVIQAEGEQLKGVRDLFSKVVTLLSNSGIPKAREVLYGDVLVVDKVGSARTLGLYFPSKDNIYVRPLLKLKVDHVGVMLHELGHRYWLKVLTSEVQRTWNTHYFIIGRRPKTLPKLEVGGPFPLVVKGLEGDLRIVGLKGGFQVSNGVRTVTLGIRSVLNILHRIQIQESYPTAYSAKSPEEFFCESFSLYAMNELSDEHRVKFEEILGI